MDCLARIRSNLLLFIKPLILQQYQFSSTAVGNPFPPQGEEVDSLFNFLSTVKEVCPCFREIKDKRVWIMLENILEINNLQPLTRNLYQPVKYIVLKIEKIVFLEEKMNSYKAIVKDKWQGIIWMGGKIFFLVLPNFSVVISFIHET